MMFKLNLMDHKDFEKKINRSLNQMEAKIIFLQEGVKGFRDSFVEFRENINEYMSFSAEKYADHESRIAKLEKQAGS